MEEKEAGAVGKEVGEVVKVAGKVVKVAGEVVSVDVAGNRPIPRTYLPIYPLSL